MFAFHCMGTHTNSMRGFVVPAFVFLLALFGVGAIGAGVFLFSSENLIKPQEVSVTEEIPQRVQVGDSVLADDDLRAELEALKMELGLEKQARLAQTNQKPSAPPTSVSLQSKKQEEEPLVKTYRLSTGVVVDEFGNIVSNPNTNQVQNAAQNSHKLTTAEITQKVANSVILIQTPTGHGSGFVFHLGKYILTNAHVVEGYSQVDLMINGNKYAGTVLGVNSQYDIAVVSAGNNVNFANLTLSDSSKVSAGDEVVALGFPVYVSSVVTVTRGIVSAVYSDYIQTDASIHPGNSGGPLVNDLGEVIGINTLGLSAGGLGGTGLGYAIPANVVKNLTGSLLSGENVGGSASISNQQTPSPGGTVNITQSIVSRIFLNPELTCTQLFNIISERTLCDLYTKSYSQYSWNIVESL